MEKVNTKPKLLFFKYKYDKHLPEFLLIHNREHIKCLSEFFDVIVIREDCDYQQICEKYEPDLTLFESGVNHTTCQRLKIKNIHAFPEIPKLGLHNADAFCNARAGFLSDMDHWGIETFFAISTTAAEHTPEIANNLFVFPNFIDPEIYHDYSGWKSIPILFTGNSNALYPWRKQIAKNIVQYFPSLICPHPGYSPRSARTQVLVGEQYARTINASWFVPACGTVAKEVVRKHFEIPGCNACLIAEKSQALEAAGFVDMKNCVFADEDNILDKIAWLFQNPDALNEIISAGYQLVHSHHTMKHRDQIFQWFKLNKNLKSSQRIIQLNPFSSPIVVQEESGITTSHVKSKGLHLTLLRQGDEELRKGKYEEAEYFYLKCANYMPWMPEPKLRLTLCNLYKGNAKFALSIIEKPIQFILAQYKAMDPDPVEWAYYIISFLCLGKLESAVKLAMQFPWLRHPELDRVRWAANVLKDRGTVIPIPNDDKIRRRYSIHQLPNRSLKEWIEQLRVMLIASGQRDMGETLSKCPSWEVEGFQEGLDDGNAKKEKCIRKENKIEEKQVSENAVAFFKKRVFYDKLKSTLKRHFADVLHLLERKFGYFLPYGISEMRHDELFKAVQNMTREEKLKTAIVIGGGIGKGSIEAFLAGAQENENMLSMFYISGSRRRFVKLKKSFANSTVGKWCRLNFYFLANLSEKPEKTVKNIKEQNQINYFDAVLVDGSRATYQNSLCDEIRKEIHEAKLVFLEDLNARCNYLNNNEMLRDPNYFLVAHDTELRNGYAIFKRR
jgi:hypothetical protein